MLGSGSTMIMHFIDLYMRLGIHRPGMPAPSLVGPEARPVVATDEREAAELGAGTGTGTRGPSKCGQGILASPRSGSSGRPGPARREGNTCLPRA